MSGGEPTTPLAPGARLGQFELVALIGAGGMGQVWEAVDASLDRRVALKVVNPERPGLPEQTTEALPRLREEAQAMARLQHPNIAVVHAIDADDDRLFIAMELLRGGSVRQWLAAAPRSWREIVGVFAAAGRGLAAAHRAGVVHCDFKPDNVLLGANGEVRVTDFGIARELAADGARATDDRGVAGTPGYMAPEQLAGRAVDARADQFSFAVALWEALTGRKPFAVDAVTGLPTAAMQLAAITRPRPAPGRLAFPAAIARVIDRGLAPDPARRYAEIGELVDALEAAARSAGRRRRTVIAAAIAAVVAATVAIVVVVRSGDEPPVDPVIPWLGTWNVTGTHTSICGARTTTDPLEASTVITRGPAAATIATQTAACRLVWRVAGARAVVEPGQQCTLFVEGAYVPGEIGASEVTRTGDRIVGSLHGAGAGCVVEQRVTLVP